MRILTNPNFNFIRWRWHAIGLSLAIIVAGFVTIWQRGGLPLGIDFSGGTAIVIKFDQPTGEDAVRSAIAPLGLESVVQRYGAPAENRILVRLPIMEGVEQGTNLEEGARRIEEALKAAGIWVPYEYRQGDTLVFPGPFTTMGIFGAYSESVELKADKTFVPVIWFSASNIVKSEMEGGPAEYNKATKQLLLANPFGHKFTVKKFEGNQLWLDVTGGMYKFEKRQ